MGALQAALVAVRVAEQDQGPGVKVQAPGVQLSFREPGQPPPGEHGRGGEVLPGQRDDGPVEVVRPRLEVPGCRGFPRQRPARMACPPAGPGTGPAPQRSPVAARCPRWPACQGRAGSPRRGAPISTPCAGRRPGARRTRGRSSAAPRAGRGSRARSTAARWPPATASLLLSMQARSSRAVHRKCDGSTTRGHWPRLGEPGCSMAETLPGGREAHGASSPSSARCRGRSSTATCS